MAASQLKHPLAGLGVAELVVGLSPEYRDPNHLREWCSVLERAASGEAVRAGCAVPVRHWKSQSTHHGIVLSLCRDPRRKLIALTHSHQKAMAVGKRIRQLATAANVGPTRGFDTIEDWQNEMGGGVVVMSANQSKLGYDCHGLYYDDPLDEYGAESPQVRDEVDGAIAHYQARCMRDGKPGPVVGVMSRWHRDDPFGRRLLRTAAPFEYLHKRALEDVCEACGNREAASKDGPSPVCVRCGSLETVQTQAFAPDVWGVEQLRQVRAELLEKDPSERIWWAQFQNEPITTGGDLFAPPTHWTELPTWGYRQGYGTDFAFSQEKKADFFALIVGRCYGSKMYLLDVRRERINTPLIESTCRAALLKWGRAPIWSYQSGPEIGTSKLLASRGIPIAPVHARWSKLVRAERTISRWNAGDILVPEDNAAPWVKGFLARVAQFRGVETDDGDDEIDAMVSMCDHVMGGGGQAPRAMGKPRM